MPPSLTSVGPGARAISKAGWRAYPLFLVAGLAVATVSGRAAEPTPFLPPADQNTGAAVVIVPGVAFDGRDASNEGAQVARWLNARGIAGFVLRSPDGSEVSRAVSELRHRAAEFKLSPRRIALLGFGRGAELAADAAVPGIPEPILLWPNGAPEAVPDVSGVFTDEDKTALYAFPARAGNNSGAAMLVIPGGGLTNRGMDAEGEV